MKHTLPLLLLLILWDSESCGQDADAKKQASILLIGNSLTWDTRPPLLSGEVFWHVDCGKSLAFIQQHPANPCVKSSTLWPAAMKAREYDFVCVQPHYGTTVEEDLSVISTWVREQPSAVFVIHTGWAKHELFAAERASRETTKLLTHSDAYFNKLIERLRQQHPRREFRSTRAMNLLFQIADDIEKGKAPIPTLPDIYRDAIHMKLESGRYLMHNAMRIAVDQPVSAQGFPTSDEKVRAYLTQLLVQHAADRQQERQHSKSSR